MSRMKNRELVRFLHRKIARAMNDADGDISSTRQENYNLYVGAPYGDERAGYSQFVTREALEVVEYVLPSVLRVFLSGDRVVSFEPANPEDEQAAQQETDATNYYVMQANNGGEGGFLAMHNWVKDALMYPNGYIKAYMHETTYTDVGVITGIDKFGLQKVLDNPDATIIEQRSYLESMETVDPMTGMPIMVADERFDIRVRTSEEKRELRIEACPPEEVLVDSDCRSLNLDEADFVCHRVRRTFTELVNMGYSAKQLDRVGTHEDYDWNDEKTNRLFFSDEDPDAADEDDESMRQFWVHECYARVDYDGDGLGELRRVVMIGDEVFENEETNYQPFVALSSIIMQHKHTGMSFIEIVKDLQLLSSILTRQMLDNIYRLNVNKKFFNVEGLTRDGSTMEAMQNTQTEYVPVQGVPQSMVMNDNPTSLVGQILPVMQFVEEQKTMRSGVSPETGVRANELQEVRQDVFNNAMDRASQRIEMLVRIFAETGFRQLFIKVHQLLRSHWDMQRMMKLRGEWVNIDPQGWRHRTSMHVEVGLGYLSKPQLMGMLDALIEKQIRAMELGMAGPVQLFNSAEKYVNAAGVGDVRSFFIDPRSPQYQPPQPQPDPQQELAQAQGQALVLEQQRAVMEAQTKAREQQQRLQVELLKAQEAARSSAAERELRAREVALKEFELAQKNPAEVEQIRAKTDEIRARVQGVYASADQSAANAVNALAQAGATYEQALREARVGGEQAAGGSEDAEEPETAEGSEDNEPQ